MHPRFLTRCEAEWTGLPVRRVARRLCAAFCVLVVLTGCWGGCQTWTPVRSQVTLTPGKVVEGGGSYTWSPGTGWVRPSEGTWGPPSQIRAESLKAFTAGSYADALDGFLYIRNSQPSNDPLVAEASFYIGECYYNLGEYTKAVDAYREVYRSGKADESLLNRSFQRINEIALDYLSGSAGQFFLLPFIQTRGPDEGIEILLGEQGLITQYPYLSFADDDIMEIAKYQYDAGDYAEAERLYKRVVTEYPGREWTEPAQFQLAMSIYSQIRGIAYDPTIIQNAEKNFRRYLEENPRGKQAEAARDRLRELAEMQGQSNLQKAKFYLRENQLPAAKLYLQTILENYPRTAAAGEAREIQQQINRVESGT